MIAHKLYTSVNDLPDSWDALPINDLFLKTPFLRALENSSPSNITTYFLGIFSSEILVGIAILQRVELYVNDVFRETSNPFFKRFGKWLITKIVRGNALIVGNLMHTGQHGLYFNPEHIEQDQFLDSISEGLKTLSKHIKQNHNKKVRIIAFKDYFKEDAIHLSEAFFRRKNFYKAQVQPNMIFEVKSHWKSPQDYVFNFNKKYRSRYRTALKKIGNIQRKELRLEDVHSLGNHIYQLYEKVCNNAGINSFKLHENHFYNLKLELKEDFKIFGYFKGNTLIGFYTLILNGDQLETYFLGYNQELQQQHQMYLNMLFDMASFGIRNQFDKVVFARTAMEIKSSIGASPEDMFLYVKHTNTIIANTVLKGIVKYANPVRDWDERHPFR